MNKPKNLAEEATLKAGQENGIIPPRPPESSPGERDAVLQAYARKSRLTIPLVSMKHRDSFRCEVLGEVKQVPMASLALSETGEVPLVAVRDLDTGEEGQLIVPAILQGVFDRMPGGYVGKKFEIVNGAPMPGKRYRALEIYELE